MRAAVAIDVRDLAARALRPREHEAAEGLEHGLPAGRSRTAATSSASNVSICP